MFSRQWQLEWKRCSSLLYCSLNSAATTDYTNSPFIKSVYDLKALRQQLWRQTQRTQWLRTLVAPAEAPFDSQQPHSSSQPPVTSVTGAPVASSGFHRHSQIHMQAHMHIDRSLPGVCHTSIPVLKRQQQAALSEFEICIASSSLARAMS